jgi:cell division protein FtsZ
MAGMGRALMGTGIGTGKKRATEAAETAISSPLLEDVNIEGATGILINITGGPDLTLHEVNEASSLIQQAAHEDANIIFGSVIDPNLSEEVRITVIATGFDRAAKTETIVPEINTRMPAASTPPATRRASNPQIAIPYDMSSQITKEYPPMTPTRKAEMLVIDEPEIDVTFDSNDSIERALTDLVEPHHHAFASGSGPAPVMGEPLVQPTDRKRAQSRPSMKAVLAGEIDTESELDVPTFIRRHSATNH